jgi:hypothetical protein
MEFLASNKPEPPPPPPPSIRFALTGNLFRATKVTPLSTLNPKATSFIPRTPANMPAQHGSNTKSATDTGTKATTTKTPTQALVRLATYNIRDGRNSRIQLLTRNLTVQKIDICIATEMRIPAAADGGPGIHTRNDQGYDVFCTYTTKTNQGGIALISRANAENWHIEATQRHGPNVLSCLLVSGNKSTPLIGAYIPPRSLLDMPHLTTALARFEKHTVPPLVLGDLNIDL